MGDKTKRLTLELDEYLFYQLKEICVKNRTTIKQFVTELVKNELNKT